LLVSLNFISNILIKRILSVHDITRFSNVYYNLIISIIVVDIS
jgi:hypothetical protein